MSTWKRISWAPDYEVSDAGQVRSHRHQYGRPGGRILRGWAYGYGYRAVTLVLPDMSQRNTQIHHLVAEIFLGKRPPGAVVRHLNGNGSDNRVANLSYGTQAQNMRDMLLHGNHNQARKTHCIHGHEYTPENTILRPRENGRRCRTCRAAQDSRRLARLRAERGAA